jgi:TRAP-type uncharacterized transport system fused permease subunit
MMKKAGFRPHVAGGVEPAASIAGMFMPPIMGAGGFIMAELTGVPYSRIMMIAIFPAIMYVYSVYNMVHWEAKIHNIKGEKSEKPAMEILKTEWYYILPLVVITALMLMGYSAGFAAVTGIVSCIVVSWFNKETRMGPKELLEAARGGAEDSLKIGATVGVIGIIIAVLTFSGLILTFADIVIQLAAGKLYLTILFIALASLVLGMGVPVTAAYLITAVVAVPALTHLGVNELAAPTGCPRTPTSPRRSASPPLREPPSRGRTCGRPRLRRSSLRNSSTLRRSCSGMCPVLPCREIRWTSSRPLS